MLIRADNFDKRAILETTYIGGKKKYQWATYCRECLATHPELAAEKWPAHPGA